MNEDIVASISLGGAVFIIFIILLVVLIYINRLWWVYLTLNTAYAINRGVQTVNEYGSAIINKMSEKVPNAINQGVQAIRSGTDTGVKAYQTISNFTLGWFILLFITIIIFFVNLFRYVLETDTKLNQYYNEQNICGKTVLEKDTLRFRMPDYHKQRYNSSFRILNYVTFGLFVTIGIFLFRQRNLLFGLVLFFILFNLMIIIINETHLRGSVDEIDYTTIYNQGEMGIIKDKIKTLLEEKFWKDDKRIDITTNTETCKSDSPLCNFPPELQDRIYKRIKINNDLTIESPHSLINAAPDKVKYILSYLNFTPESNDLELLFDSNTIAKDYSVRKNINYIQTPNNKIDVNDTEGIYKYYKGIYSPYIAIAIASSLLIFFIIFLIFKRNGYLIYLISIIIILYIIKYIVGISF